MSTPTVPTSVTHTGRYSLAWLYTVRCRVAAPRIASIVRAWVTDVPATSARLHSFLALPHTLHAAQSWNWAHHDLVSNQVGEDSSARRRVQCMVRRRIFLVHALCAVIQCTPAQETHL
jgi:hypothetical protein